MVDEYKTIEVKAGGDERKRIEAELNKWRHTGWDFLNTGLVGDHHFVYLKRDEEMGRELDQNFFFTKEEMERLFYVRNHVMPSPYRESEDPDKIEDFLEQSRNKNANPEDIQVLEKFARVLRAGFWPQE